MSLNQITNPASQLSIYGSTVSVPVTILAGVGAPDGEHIASYIDPTHYATPPAVGVPAKALTISEVRAYAVRYGKILILTLHCQATGLAGAPAQPTIGLTKSGAALLGGYLSKNDGTVDQIFPTTNVSVPSIVVPPNAANFCLAAVPNTQYFNLQWEISNHLPAAAPFGVGQIKKFTATMVIETQ